MPCARWARRGVAALLGVLLLLTGAARATDVGAPIRLAAADTSRYTLSPDGLLAKSMLEIRASRMDAALKDIDQLIAARPDFKLAHLIKGDILMAKSAPLATLGAAPAGSGQKLTDLRDEARVRLMRYVDQPPSGYLPQQILMMSAQQRYALLADAERARLYVFQNVEGEPRLIADYYMTIGRKGAEKRFEGDQKTPVGVYTISQKLPSAQLTDFYGAGAFPLNYPNEWDRKQGNTGHGIWLHGVPSDTYSRPPRSSDGCVVVSNPDLLEIAKYVTPGVTPMIIATRTDWLERGQWQALRKAILDRLDTWKSDWESLDVDLYFGHYSSRFLAEAGNAWMESKRRNISQKQWIRISMSDLSIYLYPAGSMAVVDFMQTYGSDKFTDSKPKRIYLQQDRGQWRIAMEEILTPGHLVARK